MEKYVSKHVQKLSKLKQYAAVTPNIFIYYRKRHFTHCVTVIKKSFSIQNTDETYLAKLYGPEGATRLGAFFTSICFFLSPLLASLLASDKNSERRFRFGQKVDPAIHTILKKDGGTKFNLGRTKAISYIPLYFFHRF